VEHGIAQGIEVATTNNQHLDQQQQSLRGKFNSPNATKSTKLVFGTYQLVMRSKSIALTRDQKQCAELRLVEIRKDSSHTLAWQCVGEILRTFQLNGADWSDPTIYRPSRRRRRCRCTCGGGGGRGASGSVGSII
jgi:hypothetical protein